MKKIIIIVLVLIALMVALILLKPEKTETPQDILNKAYLTTLQAETFHSEITFNANFIGEDDTGEAGLKIKSLVNLSDLYNPMIAANIDFYIKDGFMKEEQQGEIRIINGIVYAKSIDEEYWQKENINERFFLPGDSFEEMISEIEKELLLEEGDILKVIEKKYYENNIWIIEDNKSSEKINGQKLHDYSVKLDEDNFINFVVESVRELVEKSQHEEAKLYLEEGIKEIKATIRQQLIMFGGLDFNILIGQEDYLIYQILMEKEVNIPFEGKLIIDFKITNSNFGEPVIIEEPGDDEMSEKISRADHAMIQAYMSSLRASVELYSFENSYSYENACFDEESGTKNLIDSIEEITGVGTVTCMTSVDKYCILVNLIDQEDICIDYTGIIGDYGSCVDYSCLK